MIGTRKGLFLIRGDDERRSFELEGPLLPGWQINHAILDPRDGAVYACANSWVYGGTVQRSTDLGKTWTAVRGPRTAGGERAEARFDLAPRARPCVRAGHALARRRAGGPLPLGRLGRDLAGERRRAQARDPREVGARRGRVDHALDHARPGRREAAVDRDLGGGVFRTEDARRDLAAGECRARRRASCRRTASRRSASACTRCSPTRASRGGSGSRITAASTARTTTGRAGNGSTGTGFRRDSDSVSRSIRATPTARS